MGTEAAHVTTPAEAEAAILALVEERDHVSVSEIRRFEWAQGRWEIVHQKFDNLVLATHLSKLAVDAIGALIERKSITYFPCSFWVYLADGGIPAYPRARSARSYKRPHWVPIVFRPGRYATANDTGGSAQRDSG